MLLVYGLFLGLILLLLATVIHMWRTANQDRIIFQDLYFNDFPEGFGDVRIFLYLIFIDGSCRIN